MIFGFALMAGGYAVFYWGLHHFCNVDCIKGEQNPNGCCDNRVSLFDALGVPSKWEISKAPPVQLNPLQTGNTNGTTAPQPGSPGAAPPGQPTQPQVPNNNKTNLPGVTGGFNYIVPSQSPSIPQGVYLNQPNANADAGGVTPGAFATSAPVPSSVIQPKQSWGQDFLNWGKDIFGNPTSVFSLGESWIKGTWDEIKGLL